jgi:3-deoxy-D-arabino-heptulosonate 7-phosphate (DAHP) synthase
LISCGIDVEYFPDPDKALTSALQDLSAEDAELLAALKDLASEDVVSPMLLGRYVGF